MSASRSRTRFAAPFIVTVAAAGCSNGGDKTSNPPLPRFPGVTHRVHMADMLCFANENVLAPRDDKAKASYNPPPPRAIECPPGMSGNTMLTVGELGPSECGIVPDGCTNKSCVKLRTPCPLPPGMRYTQKLANVWTIEKRGDKCHAEEGDGEHDDCPPGKDCNPPAPRFVPCPPGITEAADVHVAEMPDATCVIVPPGCHDSGCVGGKIACPTESPL